MGTVVGSVYVLAHLAHKHIRNRGYIILMYSFPSATYAHLSRHPGGHGHYSTASTIPARPQHSRCFLGVCGDKVFSPTYLRSPVHYLVAGGTAAVS